MLIQNTQPNSTTTAINDANVSIPTRSAGIIDAVAMSHFNIVVDDIDVASDYYKRVFGFEEGMTVGSESTPINDPMSRLYNRTHCNSN